MNQTVFWGVWIRQPDTRRHILFQEVDIHMEHLTRRRFLGWSSAGAAAGVGLAALVPHLVSKGIVSPSVPAATASQAAAPVLPAFSNPVVAYVHNAASGNLSLMAGTQEITVHDPDLVARLVRGVAGGR